jgi:hypothetical protein
MGAWRLRERAKLSMRDIGEPMGGNRIYAICKRQLAGILKETVIITAKAKAV